LDAIVALRASLVAFNSPHVQSASSDDQFADLYSLCATRCCDAAVAFVDSKSPPTPTQIARSIQSAPLLSPDSSGADGFEGALAAHTACDLLNMVSWLTCQSVCDSVADAAGADRLCPIDLVVNMAAAAAHLSDSHMYVCDLIRFSSIVRRIFHKSNFCPVSAQPTFTCKIFQAHTTCVVVLPRSCMWSIIIVLLFSLDLQLGPRLNLHYRAASSLHDTARTCAATGLNSASVPPFSHQVLHRASFLLG
jgi:hypothetical protein